jgi:hypothetical protein
MAEGEGFEPPVRFPVQWFSRPPVSTAHASLRALYRLPVSRFPPHFRLNCQQQVKSLSSFCHVPGLNRNPILYWRVFPSEQTHDHGLSANDQRKT